MHEYWEAGKRGARQRQVQSLMGTGVMDKYFRVKLNEPVFNLILSIVEQKQQPKFKNNLSVAFIHRFGPIHPATGRPPLIMRQCAPSGVYNPAAASIHRFGRKLPDHDAGYVSRFVSYARSLSKLAWPHPIPKDDFKLYGFAEWLEDRNYPRARRNQLGKTADEIHIVLSEEVLKVKSHLKAEGYEETKCPRAINSPSDLSKIILGAVSHLMDLVIFSHRVFVKGSDPKTWVERQLNAFESNPVVETDFSSFEAHHEGMFVLLFWELVERLLSELEDSSNIRELMKTLILGRNIIEFKEMTARVDQKLMSGALWTSSQNSFLDYMIMSFLSMDARYPDLDPISLSRKGYDEFNGLFEGDDGISLDYGIKAEQIDRLGIYLKLSHHDHFWQAKFCGQTCDPFSGIIVKDPSTVFRKFFVLPIKYRNYGQNKLDGLMRARALSYMYLYHDAPIVGALTDYVARCTANKCLLYDKDLVPYLASDAWLRTKPWHRLSNPTVEARYLVEEKFGYSVEEQIELEKLLHECNGDLRFSLDEHQVDDEEDFMDTYLTEYPEDWVEPDQEMDADILFHLKPTRARRDLAKMSEPACLTEGFLEERAYETTFVV